MSTFKSIGEITRELRRRLAEFRYQHIDQDESLHVNTVEIALGLVEFAIRVDRKIQVSEVQWFNGGKEIDHILGSSNWKDIADLYYELIAVAKKQSLFSKYQ